MIIKRSVVAVPARLASSRLPGKFLQILAVANDSRVLEQCAKAHGPFEVVLCDGDVAAIGSGLGFQY